MISAASIRIPSSCYPRDRGCPRCALAWRLLLLLLALLWRLCLEAAAAAGAAKQSVRSLPSLIQQSHGGKPISLDRHKPFVLRGPERCTVFRILRILCLPFIIFLHSCWQRSVLFLLLYCVARKWPLVKLKLGLR